jgi:glucose dehydrogenase
MCFAVLLPCSIGGSGEGARADGVGTQSDDWITINKDYSSQRYVDLDQITPNNVGRLKEVCEVDLNEPSWFSSGILKIGRTLYVTTRRMTYAIDGETCDLLWQWQSAMHRVAGHDAERRPQSRRARRRTLKPTTWCNGRLRRGTASMASRGRRRR